MNIMNRDPVTPITRRRFLKTADATALAAGFSPAIMIPGRAQPKTLKIGLPKNASASFNQWFAQFAQAWGEKNNTQIILEWILLKNVQRQRQEEAAAQRDHDILHSSRKRVGSFV